LPVISAHHQGEDDSYFQPYLSGTRSENQVFCQVNDYHFFKEICNNVLCLAIHNMFTFYANINLIIKNNIKINLNNITGTGIAK